MACDCPLYNFYEQWNQNNKGHKSLRVGDSDNSYLSIKAF